MPGCGQARLGALILKDSRFGLAAGPSFSFICSWATMCHCSPSQRPPCSPRVDLVWPPPARVNRHSRWPRARGTRTFPSGEAAFLPSGPHGLTSPLSGPQLLKQAGGSQTTWAPGQCQRLCALDPGEEGSWGPSSQNNAFLGPWRPSSGVERKLVMPTYSYQHISKQT